MPAERQAPQKRRHLPFKPPSRASKSGTPAATTSGSSKAASKTKKATETATTASSSKASKPVSRTTKPKPVKLSSSRQRPSPSPSNSASASASDRDGSPAPSSASTTSSDNSASEANYILAEITHADPAETEDVLSSDPLIPPKLLTKLVHHHFRSEKTKIAKDANAVVAKYIDVFVREAVARAAFERSEEDKGAGDGFLEVEDLEKMGPQLAMDF